MNQDDFINKIDYALQNVAMPTEIRDLLIELKLDVPTAINAEQRMELFTRWIEIITTTVQIVYEISKNN